MRSEIEDLHSLRIAFFDTLDVKDDHSFKPRPEQRVQRVPVLVQGFHVLEKNRIHSTIPSHAIFLCQPKWVFTLNKFGTYLFG